MEKCQSQHYLKLSFKYFAKPFLIPKLSPKIVKVLTTIFRVNAFTIRHFVQLDGGLMNYFMPVVTEPIPTNGLS